jgi:dihydroflavonol-4-reductase
MLWEVASGKMRIMWNAAQPTVDIRDAAQAMLLAEKLGRIGERYIIANEFLRYGELFGLAAAEGGQKPPIVLPLAFANASAAIVEPVLKLLQRKDYLVRIDAVFLSIAFGELDSAKARRELHWKPRPMAETVKDSIAWFRQRKNLAQIEMAPIFGHW